MIRSRHLKIHHLKLLKPQHRNLLHALRLKNPKPKIIILTVPHLVELELKLRVGSLPKEQRSEDGERRTREHKVAQVVVAKQLGLA